MAEFAIKNISLVFFWFAIGALCAVLFMRSIKSSLRSLNSGKRPLSALLIMSGALMRWLVMGSLLYISIKIHITIALSLVAGFSLARFALIINLSRKAEQDKNESGIG